MKKFRFLVFALLAPLLSGCDLKVTEMEFDENQYVEQNQVKGALGEFSLLTPENGAEIVEMPTFTWTASENAITYTLEICEVDSFIFNVDSIIYIKQSNISGTSFKLTSPLKTKNINYYWRVTAVNPFNNTSTGKEKVSDTRVFTYKSQNVEEINIPVGEDGDWTLHKDGSYADVSIDKNNFFGEGDSETLKIAFDSAHTHQGIEESDGWIVVTKALEMDLYGTDSLYLNFYYVGDDADVLIRLIDADGEYWYKNIQVSRNAKQKVLLKFSEFTLRTKDTTVQNEIFNYEHIQFLEVVFERSFGDGCCFIGNMRAVNFNNYSRLFIEKVNFNNYPTEDWINESYDFKKTISDDGSELNLEYSTTAGFNGNEKGIGSYGYGFAKIPLQCYFVTGNAMKVKIKYSGYKSNVKALIRIYEEDKDRWFYEQPFSQLVENEFVELTIPFATFAKSDMSGDGNRQFYYILNLQLGVSGVYGSGTIAFKDIEIITMPSVSSNPIKVGGDGVIENFDSYFDRTEIYTHWESSVENKDEGIFLNSQEKFAKGGNVYAGQFNYKSDMSMATYDVYTDVEFKGGNALKVNIKDASVLKSGDPALSFMKEDDVTSTIILQLALSDGRWYRYEIKNAARKWTEYTIKFDDFKLEQGIVLEDSIPFLSENVVNFAFGIYYFYYDSQGKSHPVYSESNPVYFDDILFTNAEETKVTLLERELHPTDGKTLIDDFEYSSESELTSFWMGLNGLDYEKISLSSDVSSQGGSHSMKLDYKGATSPSYAIYPAFGSDVQAKALQFDIKGDDVATIYINLYVRAGTSLKQYRHTITNPSSAWTRYVVGLDKTLFVPLVSTDPALNINSIVDVQRITFGIVGTSGSNLSSIYVDNLLADSTVRSFLTHTVTKID